jgi:hypothetical protein
MACIVEHVEKEKSKRSRVGAFFTRTVVPEYQKITMHIINNGGLNLCHAAAASSRFEALLEVRTSRSPFEPRTSNIEPQEGLCRKKA